MTNKPLRFAFVISDLSGGGAEKAVLKIAKLLADRGHSVRVVLLSNERSHPVPQSIEIDSIASGIPSRGWFGKRLAAIRLRKTLDGGKLYHLVVSSLPYADEVAHLARLVNHRCRIANTLSAEISALAGRDGGKAKRRISRYRKLYGNGSVVAVSHGVARDLETRFGVHGPVPVIPNPFDLEEIRAKALEIDDDIPDQPYVLHVGRFARQKRHDLLLDAWVRLGSLALLVLLTEPNAELIAMVRARGLEASVRIAGFRQNPYSWMARAQLLVLCSDHEGLPNVLIEAISCGTPVVSTNCPSGPAEILSAFPDSLVPCGDSAALADAIARTLASPPDLAKFDFSPYLPDRIASAWEALATS